jgi:hypothetical protein
MRTKVLLAPLDAVAKPACQAMSAFRLNIPPKVAIAASLALFMASLALPALEFADHEPERGHVLLLWGWWGFLTGDFPWLANPLYLVALIFAGLGRRTISQLFSGSAFAVGLLSLRVSKWYFNEANATPIENLGSAFYFWMASFLVLFVLVSLTRKRDQPAGDRVNAK